MCIITYFEHALKLMDEQVTVFRCINADMRFRTSIFNNKSGVTPSTCCIISSYCTLRYTVDSLHFFTWFAGCVTVLYSNF